VNAKFLNVIHFIPDIFIGSRVAIGALVYDNGNISFLPHPKEPCQRCLGTSGVTLVSLVLRDLKAATFKSMYLPPSCGPQVVLASGIDIPSLADAIDWTKKLLAEV